MQNIYADDFQKSLFNEMAKTYGIVNTLSSFGLNYLWRKVCVDSAGIKDFDNVCDFMAGGGENGFHIQKNIVGLTCIDYSEVMVGKCLCNVKKFKYKTHVIMDNVFILNLPNKAYDKIVCSFGLKTLNLEGRKKLIQVMLSCLKDDGIISLMEFEIPKNSVIRTLWVLYVKYLIPIIGRLFMGNSDNYKMLYQYALNYDKDGKMNFLFENRRILVKTKKLHFGSARNFIITKLTSQSFDLRK
jgi:ubiquinone/menaquinone biosynthesis C-methylase UbiE